MPEITLGMKVVIKECHKMPGLVGKEGKVIALTDEEYFHYPLQIILVTPLQIETPFGLADVSGPFPFRPDELEVIVPPKIPDAFNKAFDGDKPEDKASV